MNLTIVSSLVSAALGFGLAWELQQVFALHSVRCSIGRSAGWCKNRVFYRPSQFLNSVSYNTPCQSHSGFPLGNYKPFASAFKNFIGRSISCLLSSGSPSAVFRTVWSIVVNSINGMTFTRSIAHISQKCAVVRPLIANIYTSTAVSWIGPMRWVVASFSHRNPCGVLFDWRIASLIFCMSVGKSSSFSSEASARTCRSANKTSALNGSSRPAFAKTFPKWPFMSTGILLRDCKTTEFFSCKVFELWHFFTLKCVTVIGAWQPAVNRFSGATLAKPVYFISNSLAYKFQG